MTENQVHDILKRIAAAYSRFEITEMVVDVWTKQLLKMDYERVLFNLEKHISEEKWPPAIAEIAALPKPKNEHLEKIKQWEKESIYARKHRS